MKALKITIALAIILLIITTLQATKTKDEEQKYGAEHWTQYRGPNRNGKIDSKYHKESIDILWSYKYKGGKPTPVIVYDDVVYFGTFTGDVYSLNKEGLLNWKINIKSSISNSLAYCKETIIAVSDLGEVFGINAKNGKIKWQYSSQQIKKQYEVYQAFHPIIEGGKVFVTYGNEIAVLEAQTGQLVLKIKHKNNFRSAPLLGEHSIFTKAYRAISFDKQSGKIKWISNSIPMSNTFIYSYKGDVYYPDIHYLEGINQETGKEAKTLFIRVRDNFGIIDKDKLYYTYTDHGHLSSEGILSCRDLATDNPRPILYKSKGGGYRLRGSISDIIMVGNYIYYYRNKYELYCLDKRDSKKVYSKELPTLTLCGSIAYANGKLYLTSKAQDGEDNNTIFALE